MREVRAALQRSQRSEGLGDLNERSTDGDVGCCWRGIGHRGWRQHPDHAPPALWSEEGLVHAVCCKDCGPSGTTRRVSDIR